MVVLGSSPRIPSLEKSILRIKRKFRRSKLCDKAYLCWLGRLQSLRANQTDSVSLVSGILQRKGFWWGKTQVQRSTLSGGIQQGVLPRTINTKKKKKKCKMQGKEHSSGGGERGRDRGRVRDKGISRGGVELLTKAFWFSRAQLRAHTPSKRIKAFELDS